MPQKSPSPQPYRRDAIPVGPFENEPFELMSIVLGGPDEPLRSGDLVTDGSETWLIGALEAAGVVLGEYDRTAVRLLAEDGWTTVQVVAGWIARAHESRSDAPEEQRTKSDSGPT